MKIVSLQIWRTVDTGKQAVLSKQIETKSLDDFEEKGCKAKVLLLISACGEQDQNGNDDTDTIPAMPSRLKTRVIT